MTDMDEQPPDPSLSVHCKQSKMTFKPLNIQNMMEDQTNKRFFSDHFFMISY